VAQLIYLADDEEALLEVFGTFLQSAGYDVQMFPTGDELFAAFQEHPSDLVILDIMMPGTDGLTICKKLRKFSDVPIIILTAKDSEMDYLHGLAIGGDDYLIKPFSPAMLVMRVRALLRRVAMSSANAKRDTDTLTFGDVRLSSKTHEACANGVDLGLTMT
jgi:DNA-binding response OmpR family regulator